MALRQIAKKFQAVVALLALLAPIAPVLADSLSADNSTSCCNGVMCPMHRGQKVKNICGARGQATPDESCACSMQACSITPPPVVGTGLLILVKPIAMRSPANAGPAQIWTSRFIPSILSIPLTPPPRTILS